MLLLLALVNVAVSLASPARLASNAGQFKLALIQGSTGMSNPVPVEVSFQVAPHLASANAEITLRPIDGQIRCADGTELHDPSDSMSDGAVRINVRPGTMTEGRTLRFRCAFTARGKRASAVNAELRSWGPAGNSMGMSSIVLETQADGSFTPSTMSRLIRRLKKIPEVHGEPTTQPYDPAMVPGSEYESPAAVLPRVGGR